MKSRTLVATALSSSLFVMACAHRSSLPAAEAPAAEAPAPELPAQQRPPPGTRIETWPDLGVWSVTKHELPGTSDPFLWEKAAVSTPPKAQIPLRLHRPVD